jgi:hypothetical protein
MDTTFGVARPFVCLVLCLLFGFGGLLSTGCASSRAERPTTIEDEADPLPEKYRGPTPPEWEIAPYLIEEGGLFLRMDVERWDTLAPVVTEALGLESSWHPLAALLGLERDSLETLSIARERDLFAEFEPRLHDPEQVCLSTGLPCGWWASLAPRFGRVFIPTESPNTLESQLHNAIPDARASRIGIVSHEYYVRIEFAVGGSWSEKETRQYLQRRMNDEPIEETGHVSAAKATVLEGDGLVGLHASLRELVELAAYMRARDMRARTRDDASEEVRLRERMREAVEVARVFMLDDVERTLFEDVALLVEQNEDDTLASTIVGTRTYRGQRYARIASIETGETEFELKQAREKVSSQWRDLVDHLQAIRRAAGVDARMPLDALVDVVTASTPGAPVRASRGTEDAWAALHLSTNDAEAIFPRTIDALTPTRTPHESCLDQLSDMTVPLLERALRQDEPFAYLEEELSQLQARFQDRAFDCAASENETYGRWAADLFDVWRAIVLKRTGRVQRARSLLEESCGQDLEQACRMLDEE